MEFDAQLFDLIYEHISGTKDKVHFALTCKSACSRYYFIALCEHLAATGSTGLLKRSAFMPSLLSEKECDDVAMLLGVPPDEAREFVRLFAISKCVELSRPRDEILNSRARHRYYYGYEKGENARVREYLHKSCLELQSQDCVRDFRPLHEFDRYRS